MASSEHSGTHPPQPLQTAALDQGDLAVVAHHRADGVVGACGQALAAPGAGVLVDQGHQRVELGVALLEQGPALGHCGEAGGHALRGGLGALAGTGDHHPVDDGLHRPQLGVDLVVEAVVAQGQLEQTRQALVLTRHHAGHQDHEVDRKGQLLRAGQQVHRGDVQPAVLGQVYGRGRVVGVLHEHRAALARLGVQQLLLAVRADVAVEVVLVDRGVELVDQQRRHARWRRSRTSSSTRCRPRAAGCPRSRCRRRCAPACRGASGCRSSRRRAP